MSKDKIDIIVARIIEYDKEFHPSVLHPILIGGMYRILREEILKNEIDLCVTCKKSNICSPHINYGVNAISCKKYIKRKGIK